MKIAKAKRDDFPQIIREVGAHIIVGCNDYYYFPFVIKFDGDDVYIYETADSDSEYIDRIIDYMENYDSKKEKEV